MRDSVLCFDDFLPPQIGAIDSWGENCFNEFIWPRRHVHPKASLTNNFTTDHKSLYRSRLSPCWQSV